MLECCEIEGDIARFGWLIEWVGSRRERSQWQADVPMSAAQRALPISCSKLGYKGATFTINQRRWSLSNGATPMETELLSSSCDTIRNISLSINMSRSNGINYKVKTKAWNRQVFYADSTVVRMSRWENMDENVGFISRHQLNLLQFQPKPSLPNAFLVSWNHNHFTHPYLTYPYLTYKLNLSLNIMVPWYIFLHAFLRMSPRSNRNIVELWLSKVWCSVSGWIIKCITYALVDIEIIFQ